MIDKSLKPGQRVKAALKEAGLHLYDLADRTGLTYDHISKVVKGKRSVTVEIAKAASELTGVRTDFFLGIDDFETDKNVSDYLNDYEYVLDHSIDLYFMMVAELKMNVLLTMEFPLPEDRRTEMVGPTYQKYFFKNKSDNSLIVIDHTEMGAYKRDLMDYAELLLRRIIREHTKNTNLYPESPAKEAL